MSTPVGSLREVQFQSLFKVVWAGTITADISNAATGSGTFGTATVSVPSTQIGDMVLLFPGAGSNGGTVADTAGAPRFADVPSAGNVRVTVLNNSAGAVDYASQTYTIVVLRPNFAP